MRIYISGIGGSGLAPLANLALDAGHQVCGSDSIDTSFNCQQLRERGVQINQDQTGQFLKQMHGQAPIDHMIYTSALPADSPELAQARELGIKSTKRDQFIPEFIKEHNLRLIAIAGTHGKTSTTNMAVWLFNQLQIPISYLAGSNLAFGPSGNYAADSEFFVYECDEYDRNFLHYQPELSLITSIDYDHVDTYPTLEEYQAAFAEFIDKSKLALCWEKDIYPAIASKPNLKVLANDQVDARLKLPGIAYRQNSNLVVELVKLLNQERDFCPVERAIELINQTPQPKRRFEQLKPNLISDYAHHPSEIKATIELANEYKDLNNFQKLVIIYQPHQNQRQHQFYHQYRDSFTDADTVYWLPTYLVREDPSQAVLTPEQLTADITADIHFAQADSQLKAKIDQELAANNLVVIMSAGPLDDWLRANFS